MTREFEIPPHFFDPDDKRSYLLLVFQDTPFVPLAVPNDKNDFCLYDFPRKTGIYALYLTDAPISNLIPDERRVGDLVDDDVQPPPPWNTNGFGSNAPGAGRPGKRAKPPDHFDVLYPPKPG